MYGKKEDGRNKRVRKKEEEKDNSGLAKIRRMKQKRNRIKQNGKEKDKKEWSTKKEE